MKNEKPLWAEYIRKSYENLQDINVIVNSFNKQNEITIKAQYGKIIAYIERLENLYLKYKDNKRFRDLMFDLIVKSVVVRKENIEEDYYYTEHKIAIQRGETVDKSYITEEYKEKLATQVIEDQKSRLREWYDYLCDANNNDNAYPTWFRFYAFAGSTTLSIFDKKNNKFKKRDKTTTAMFPYLDREALSIMYDALNDYFNNNLNNVYDEFRQIQMIAKQHDFNTLYSFVIAKLNKQRNKYMSNEVIGEWKKYNQDKTGTEAQRLVNDIKDFGTGWCTAGYETAKNQLSNGDFYVYFINDENNIPKIPKIAIRLNSNNEIAEIRGIDSNQNLTDERFVKIAEEKSKNFIGYEKYQKASKDMAKLTTIYNKQYRYDKITHEYVKKDIVEEFTKEELRFLYEIDNKIQGFGYQKDERINTLLRNKNIKEDLSFILLYTEDEISLSEEEALSGKCIYHYGNLNLDHLKLLKSNCLPKIVNGDLDLSNLTSLEPNCLPQTINGSLGLGNLKSLKPNCLPQTINRDLDLRSLKSLELNCLPQTINRDLDLRSLTSLEPNCLSQTINGSLFLNSLTSLEPNCLSQTINGSLFLSNLTLLEPNCLPQTINGSLGLGSLKSLKPNCLPQTINRDLDLRSLTSLEPNCLPKTINGDLDLRSLKSLKPNCLSQTINGDLDLSSLTSLEPNCLPQIVNGNLYLNSLTALDAGYFPKDFKFDINKFYCSSLIKEKFIKRVNESQIYWDNLKKEEIANKINNLSQYANEATHKI